MKKKFTPTIKQDEGWWIGWVDEMPGVNSQGRMRAELAENLRPVLKEYTSMFANFSGRGDKDVAQVAAKTGPAQLK